MSNTMIDSISLFCNKKIARKNYPIILLCYIALVSIISCFHEPWLDEAQAWQIARCASMYDIFFTIPHYEGHPQLWHLLLVPFAKGGLPYELSLKFINIFFSSLAVGIMLYKTKLPDMLKLAVPFSYYVFYQYGVISRPYCIMFLGLMLCAANYEKRNDKPFRYVLSMLLLCLSSAYGMALACGMCIVWIIDFLKTGSLSQAVKAMADSKVLAGLIFILIWAAAILLSILPASDSLNSTVGSTKADLLSSIAFAVLIVIYDATIGNKFNNETGLGNVKLIDASLLYIIPVVIIIWLLIIAYGKKKKKLLEFFIPFTLLGLSFVLVRMGTHHIGIVTLYLIFWLCICGNENEEAELSNNPVITSTFNISFMAFMCITVFIQSMWTVLSSVQEIKYNYSIGRDVASFIKNNNITSEDLNIFSYTYHPVDKPLKNGDKYAIILDYSGNIISALPYLDENCFANLNHGDDNFAYYSNKFQFNTPKYFEEIEYVKSLGTPKYIYDYPCFVAKKDQISEGGFGTDEPSEYTFSYYFTDHKYNIVESVRYGIIFKGSSIQSYFVIYELNE